MAAAAAAEAEIRTDAEDFPLSAAAGVWLFHCQNITDPNVHCF